MGEHKFTFLTTFLAKHLHKHTFRSLIKKRLCLYAQLKLRDFRYFGEYSNCRQLCKLILKHIPVTWYECKDSPKRKIKLRLAIRVV